MLLSRLLEIPSVIAENRIEYSARMRRMAETQLDKQVEEAVERLLSVIEEKPTHEALNHAIVREIMGNQNREFVQRLRKATRALREMLPERTKRATDTPDRGRSR